MRKKIARPRSSVKLGYHHFALFRGSLDGLSLSVLGDRYLETGTDVRKAQRTLDWVRSELVAAAKRYNRETGVTGASFLRLIKIRPAVIDPDERIALSELPSLEDFQAEYDPTGFYSESELIAEFEKRYGGAGEGGAPVVSVAALRKAEQNDRLRRRLRQALDVLERWLVSVPRPNDPISIWIEPVVASPLASAGIVTINDLVSIINRKGNLWYRRIPKFGAVRSRRIIRWLQLNQVLPIKARALFPFRQYRSSLIANSEKNEGIVPFEYFKLPDALDGTLGTNRNPVCPAAVRTDIEAVSLWLDTSAVNRHTRRAYNAQLERFLLWLVFEKNRPLSSATSNDCQEYVDFLAAIAKPGSPWPWRIRRDQWIGPKLPRWHEEWKPFVGEMSESTRRMAVTILKRLFSWLTNDIRYLNWNPWAVVKVSRAPGKRLKVDHVLNERQWAAVIDSLEASKNYVGYPAEDERYCRLRFALWLGYTGGLRINEMLSLRVGSLHRTPDKHWELVFVGKGGKKRAVPLAHWVFAFLIDYMVARGYGENPFVWPKEKPIIGVLGETWQSVRQSDDSPLSERAFSQAIKSHFKAAADRLEDPLDAEYLRQASPHWLRHTMATNAIDRGASIATVQALLGHSDSATTALYTHADRMKMREVVEALSSITPVQNRK